MKWMYFSYIFLMFFSCLGKLKKDSQQQTHWLCIFVMICGDVSLQKFGCLILVLSSNTVGNSLNIWNWRPSCGGGGVLLGYNTCT